MKRFFPIVLRILTGLLFTGSAVAVLMGKAPPPQNEAAGEFMEMLSSSGIMRFVKITELLCGLALISGFFVPLALLVLAPIIVNILVFHLALAPEGAVMGVVMMAIWTGIALPYRGVLLPLLQPRPTPDASN